MDLWFGERQKTPDSWEVTPGFLRNWRYLVPGEQDVGGQYQSVEEEEGGRARYFLLEYW